MKKETKALVFTVAPFAVLALAALGGGLFLGPLESASRAEYLLAVLGEAPTAADFLPVAPAGPAVRAWARSGDDPALLLELRAEPGPGRLSVAALYGGGGELLAYGPVTADGWHRALAEPGFRDALEGKDPASLPRSASALGAKLMDAVSGATASADAWLGLLGQGADIAAARGRVK